MKYVPCLLCGHFENSLWGNVVPVQSSNPNPLHLNFVRCSNCGLVYANPQAENDDIVRYYQKCYCQETDVSFMLRKTYRDFLKKRLNTIRKVKPNGRILEIGCGAGNSLAFFGRYGYCVIGVEPGNWNDTTKNKSHDVPILKGFFPHPKLQNHRFDLVYAWHVIEHIPDPVDFLRDIEAHLQEDGVVLIGTENISLFCRFERSLDKVLGQPERIGTSPEHTFFPTRSTLTKILEKAGFKVLSYKIYDDNVKGHPLRPDLFFCKSLKNMIHPLNQLRWLMAASFYYFSKFANIGGSKCEIVAIKKSY